MVVRIGKLVHSFCGSQKECPDTDSPSVHLPINTSMISLIPPKSIPIKSDLRFERATCHTLLQDFDTIQTRLPTSCDMPTNVQSSSNRNCTMVNDSQSFARVIDL